MALGWQALEAQKASKPLEQGGALEQVAARMKRVMGLTPKVSGWLQASPVDYPVRPRCQKGFPDLTTSANRKKTRRHGGGAILER